MRDAAGKPGHRQSPQAAPGPDTPAVSVCIPVYNGERHLEAAISSVLAQSFQDFELVVLDNASTDRTPGIIAGFRDPRLRVLRNEHTVGMAENWNRVAAAARAPLVKLLPADDLLYPACLENQVRTLARSENSGAVMTCCSRNIINDSGQVLLRRAYPGRPGHKKGLEAIRTVVCAGTNVIGEGGAVLLRAAALRAALPFDERIPFLLDLDLWFRVLLLGGLAVSHQTLCAFRVSPGSMSVEIQRDQGAQLRAFISYVGRDPRFGLSARERLQGLVLVSLKSQLKRVFYLIHVRRNRRAPDAGK